MHHALPLGQNLGNVVLAVFQHIVVLVLGKHLLRGHAVHNVVVHLLIVADRTVVHPHASQLQVRTCAVEGDTHRGVLDKVVRGVVDVRFLPRAVDVELHQPVLAPCPYHKGHLHPGVLGEGLFHSHHARLLFLVLVGVGDARTRQQRCLGTGDMESLPAAHAADYVRRPVDDVAHLELELDGLAVEGRVFAAVEWQEVDVYPRPVPHHQRVSIPSATLPVEIVELGRDSSAGPLCRVAFIIATPGCQQLHHQPCRRLAHVDAACRHLDVELVFRQSAHKPLRDSSRTRGSHRVALTAAPYREGLGLHASPVFGHLRPRVLRVVHEPVEPHARVLGGGQRGCEVLLAVEYGAVPAREQQPDERGVLPRFQYVDISTLRKQPVIFGHQLQHMPPCGKPRGSQRELPVGGTGPRDGLGHRGCPTVHIQAHLFRAAALQGVTHHNGVAVGIAAAHGLAYQCRAVVQQKFQ